MSKTELRVTYRDADPVKIRYGKGYFGDPSSLAQMQSDEDATAIIMFDNSGGIDFKRELEKLPFIETVLNPTEDNQQ